ncbi:MAG: hypothetical protein PGN27_02370 [Mycolicibacterium neoaurum]|uniref:hypothetical protein n=1 Tax=Mycolicibacterium neoaurum TaxID=1795 RepID=UPI002FF8DE28
MSNDQRSQPDSDEPVSSSEITTPVAYQEVSAQEPEVAGQRPARRHQVGVAVATAAAGLLVGFLGGVAVDAHPMVSLTVGSTSEPGGFARPPAPGQGPEGPGGPGVFAPRPPMPPGPADGGPGVPAPGGHGPGAHGPGPQGPGAPGPGPAGPNAGPGDRGPAGPPPGPVPPADGDPAGPRPAPPAPPAGETPPLPAERPAG